MLFVRKYDTVELLSYGFVVKPRPAKRFRVRGVVMPFGFQLMNEALYV